MALNLSIVIPVLQEQQRINGLTEQLRRQNEEVEIIVVDGDPDGSTIRTIGDRSVTALIAPPGRGSQLAAGISIAKGDCILMLHADTCLPDHGLQMVRDAIQDGADFGAFRLGIAAQGSAFRTIERLVDLRCKLFTLPYGDQALFITRHALNRCGGIPKIPLMEDVALVRSLCKSGARFILLSDRVQTSARRWQQDGIFRRTFRNWWLLLRYLAGVDPSRLAKEYC